MAIYCKVSRKIEHTLHALHPGLIRKNKTTSWCAFYFFIYNKHSSIRWMLLLVMAFRFSAVASLLCSEHLKWQFIIWSLLLHLNEQFLCKYSGYCLRWETHRAENQGLMPSGTKKATTKNQLAVARQIPNYGIYCQGSSKCIITLQKKLALSTWHAAGAGAGCHSNREMAKYSLPGAGPLKVEWQGGVRVWAWLSSS